MACDPKTTVHKGVIIYRYFGYSKGHLVAGFASVIKAID